MQFALRVLISAAAVWLATAVVPGLDWSGEWWQILLIGLVVGLVNTVLKPIFTVLSIPFLVVTLGLFIVVINWVLLAIVVWLSAPERLDLGLTSADGWSTFWGSVVVSVASWGLAVMTSPVR
jgi:putative membrane protein